MSNKEKCRKGMGEVSIFNYRESKSGLYIGVPKGDKAVIFLTFNKSSVLNNTMNTDI